MLLCSQGGDESRLDLKTDTVTLMANVIPIEIPAEGPNYYNLDDTVRYRIEVDNNGDGKGDLHYALRTRTVNAPERSCTTPARSRR